jgi:hypothetical protein
MIQLSTIPRRLILARVYYGAVLFFLASRFFSKVLLSQLESPVLTDVGTDYTYITLYLTTIPGFITSHYVVALLFDISLFLVTLAAFLFPNRKYLPLAFTLLVGVYEVVGYTFLCFHKHNLTGVWWCSLMFCVIDDEGFVAMFNLTRYYCLFVYASSGFWKFFRGVWDLPGHLPVIIKTDALPYMVEHPGTALTAFLAWLNCYPDILNVAMIITSLVQLTFLIGFFTRRLDWFFFIFAVSLHVFSYYLLHAYFMEFTILLITLLPLSRLYKTGEQKISIS